MTTRRFNVFMLLFIIFFSSCSFSNKNKPPKRIRKTLRGDYFLAKKSFDFIINGDEDILDFDVTYFDYDPISQSFLLLPKAFPENYSSVMIIDNHKNINILGKSGQSPTEINGIRSTAKFIGQNLIGLITMFGESSFLVLNQEGDVVKRWHFPEFFGRIKEFKFNDDGFVFYGETIVLPDEMNKKTVIGAIDLSTSNKKILLSAKELKKIFQKYKIPLSRVSINGSQEKEMLQPVIYFFPDADYAVISSYFIPFKKTQEITTGIIFNLTNKHYIPFKIKPYFSKSTYEKNSQLIGNSVFENCFFVKEYLKQNDRHYKRFFLYGGVIHKIDWQGKKVGVLCFNDDFYRTLKKQNVSRFYIKQIRGLKHNQILCLGEAFYSNKERKQLLIKANLKKLK